MKIVLLKSVITSAAAALLCSSGLVNRAMAQATTMPAATQPTTTQPATTMASAITWDLAAKHVGETLTVTGPVVGTHVTSGGSALILNIGKDFPDPTRLSIMLQPAAAEETYKGKTVTVTGKIELFRKAAEIKAKPDDVTIQK